MSDRGDRNEDRKSNMESDGIDLNLLEKKLRRSRENYKKECSLESALATMKSTSLDEYTTILNNQLLNIKQCDQVITSASGSSRQTKDNINSSVTSLPIFINLINDLELLQKENVQNIKCAENVYKEIKLLQDRVERKKRDLQVLKELLSII